MENGKRIRKAATFILMAALAVGCAKSAPISLTKSEPMPLTKENILAYMQSMNQHGQGITVKEAEEAKGDEKKQAEVIRKMLVAPMEEMGYSYDATIRAAATKIVEKDYSATDYEMLSMLSTFMMMPAKMADKLVQFNIILPETRDVLQKIKM